MSLDPSRQPSFLRTHALSWLGVPMVLAMVSGLAGCPIYAADSCAEDPACRARTDGGAPTPIYDTGVPTPVEDTGGGGEGCGTGCDPGYVCTSATTGRYACVAYDCRATEKACPTDQQCLKDTNGVWKCGTEAPNDCTKTGCISGYACTDVAGKKVCTSTDPNACVQDSECQTKTGAGSLCLGGVCKAAKDLCSDSTQCKANTCQDGRCVSKCSATCAAGYTCNDTTGLCTAGAGACGPSKACETGKTCVGDRCVEPCATDGTCKAGLVCVAGGCVVDDRPVFFCDKDGTKDGQRDVCAAGSICLHHSCYISCSTTDPNACASADKFPVCKSVTTSSGAHQVCGSNTNLGAECDPTATPPKTCATGKVCIDGFCK